MLKTMKILGKKWIEVESIEYNKDGDLTYKQAFPISSMIRFAETKWNNGPNCTIFFDHLGSSIRIDSTCTYDEFVSLLASLEE